MVHNGKAAATRDHSGWRGLLWPTLSMLVGLAVLLSLGTWQLQRKTWKEGLLADIAARTKATPIPLDEARRRQAAGEDVEYTRVVARGRFLHDKEAFVYASGAGGPGFHLYTPLEAA
ncbi:MAG: SURF1 family protein, partial [Bacteroidota bacterium]